MTPTTNAEQSIQFTLLAAIAALIGAANCRLKPWADAELPAMNVMPDEQDIEPTSSGQVERSTRFQVRYIASGTDATTPATQAADTMYVVANALLLTGITLGGQVHAIRELKHKYEREQAEKQQIAQVVTYQIDFSTSRNDASKAGY
jgi:hypothetical protein